MKVVVVGAGRLGAQFAEALVIAGHTVTVIDLNDAHLSTLAERAAVRAVPGDACEPNILEEAGAFVADMLVATTGDDEDNLVISLLAKRQFDVRRVAALINDPDNTWLFDDKWGVDVPVSSVAPLISLIEEGTGSADTVDLLRLTHAGVNLIETVIGPGSKTVDHPLADVQLPAATVVVAVIRAGTPIIPDPTYILHANDEVLIVAAAAVRQDIERAFQ
jgi:trk system potassium uptake protein